MEKTIRIPESTDPDTSTLDLAAVCMDILLAMFHESSMNSSNLEKCEKVDKHILI
jgi:hypothetical protein